MDLSQLYLAIIIGTVLSLLVEELFGVNCGGLVTPGYLALILDDPATIALIAAISLLTYLIVNYGLARIMILFGRRRYTMMILVALILKLAVELLFPYIPYMPMASVEFRGFGAVTPALLANSYSTQGIKWTIPCCAAVTVATYWILQLINMFV